MRTFPSLLVLVLAFSSCTDEATSNLAATTGSAQAGISLSREQATAIGRKVWQNECAGTLEGLTAWNSGEDFASMGIGHFIWYPEGQSGPFKESFPLLLGFMESKGVKLPASLAAKPACPWPNRSRFLAEFNSQRSTEIRNFLAATVPEQAEFLVLRLERSLPKMLAAAAPENRQRIEGNFRRVAAAPNGLYAMIDDVNFKGEGTVASERYRGVGWGLLQVLENMDMRGSATDAFADAAKAVLTRRVANSLPARNEKRWLNGWSARTDSYR